MPDDNEKQPKATPPKTQKVNYNYPANSHKAKEEKTEHVEVKKITRITKGEVKIRKTPLSRRIVETFTGDDANSVGQYVLFEVMLPAAKNMIADAISTGIERLMFGDSRGRRGTGSSYGSSSRTSYTAYNRYSSSNSDRDRDRPSSRPTTRRVRQGHEEIILGERSDAEAILDQLVDLIERFDVATVSDLYGMIDKTPNYTDEKYGWTDSDIKHVEIRRVREGWLLDLPTPDWIE